MEQIQQFGVFWGHKSLYFVETSDLTPTLTFSIAYSTDKSETISGDTAFPEDMKIISLIQDNFRKLNIAPSNIHLSLPTKDIIFRSFIIPFMKLNEIKGVVEFEISKYIPFALEELTYSFQPIPFVEEKTKSFRIIFVAIKKDILEHYLNTLKRAELQVDIIEPAPLSIIRVLELKKLLPKEKTIAIITKESNTGKIIVVAQGIPQFVRELQLNIPNTENKNADPDALRSRLLNEIAISLDYFNRQENHLMVKQVLLISQSKTEDLSKSLEEDLEMPVTHVDNRTLLGEQGLRTNLLLFILQNSKDSQILYSNGRRKNCLRICRRNYRSLFL